jgi:transcriptional regulator with XRE-family HTH domain
MKYTIRQARALNGFSQAMVSEKLGLTLQTYIRYEKYDIIFRIDMAYKFLEIVNMTWEQLEFLTPYKIEGVKTR